MAGIFWLNRQDYGYFGHEIYLLPGQMIPEHRPMATPKGRPRWIVAAAARNDLHVRRRRGRRRVHRKVPASQRAWSSRTNANRSAIDEVARSERPSAWHFMVAGPEGALVTEYGTFHDMDGLRYSNPKASYRFSWHTS